jgi:exosortase
MPQFAQFASNREPFPPTTSGRRALWWQISVFLALALWLYSSILFHLTLQWLRDPNFSHGFLVPAFSLLVLWRDRQRLLNLPLSPSSAGLWIMAGALCMLVVGVLGAELFLSRLSFVPLIASFIVLFWGWKHLRIALFPVLFLVFMIPLPAIIFNQITLPLQTIASKLAATALPFFGVPVLREGNIIKLPAMALEVADACSGIRSLLSLITLAVICGYTIRERPGTWLVLVAAAVPIAIAANCMRIVGAGLLVQYWNPDKAEGFFHTFSGWFMFLFSVALLFSVRQLLLSAKVTRGAHS